MKRFIKSHHEEMLSLLRTLCAIPAPSLHEEARTAFCARRLAEYGAENIRVDGAGNVIVPFGDTEAGHLTVIAAHTDTVFPDTEPMALSEDDERITCPGVGDDTASVTVLMLAAKYLASIRYRPRCGLLLVCNTGEEGLGNLYGTRRLFADYAGKIDRFITLDANLGTVTEDCVGSCRYEVEAITEGGHSFGRFGVPNAIAVLADVIAKIYSLEVPAIPLPSGRAAKTTYNVGLIEGGTSVNTIAAQAKMLCEYRSDSRESLAHMEAAFARIFASANRPGVTLTAKKIGERPCSAIAPETLEPLLSLCRRVTREVIGGEIRGGVSSTDCNIPLSMGIPAACIGVYRGAGAHTRGEYIYKDSLDDGLALLLTLIAALDD